MDLFSNKLTLTYLIYPIIGILLLIVAMLIAKKNNLLSNKRLVVFVLLTILLLTLPGLLGFLGYNFMPYGYVALSLLYLIGGYYNTKIINWVFKGEAKYRHEIITTSFISIISMMLFALVFNLCNELKYGFWASTCMLSFIFTSLFIQSYNLFLNIPESIYKIWKYSASQSNETYENIDYNKLKVVTIEIFRKDGDRDPLHIKAKVPDQMPFGDWMKRMIDDYNAKNPLSAINHNGSDKDSGWIFYSHINAYFPKRYIDHDVTISDNKLKDNDFIVAKRVKESQIDNQ